MPGSGGDESVDVAQGRADLQLVVPLGPVELVQLRLRHFAAVRGVEGLYVADASLLPTPVGVNPMMTIIACATHVAGDLATSLSG